MLWRGARDVVASPAMSIYGQVRRALLLLLVSSTAMAAGELEVRVTPANSALKANIEGYVGTLDGRDRQALRRIRRIAEAEARKAAEALGYYQARIRSQIEDGETPRLILEVEPGERVRLRNVDIRIELRRGPTSITVTWPSGAAAECAMWLRELLR